MAKKNAREEPPKPQVTENEQMSDIVFILDKMELILEAVSQIGQDGKFNTVAADRQNRNSFLKIDRYADAFENFIKNFWSQLKDPTRFGILSVKEDRLDDPAVQQAIEDIALMRSIPGMVVLSPADDVEARAAVIAAYNYQGPVYLRFSRLATPVFHDPETYEFQIGKGEKLTDGYDIAVISTGLMTNEALRAAVLAKRQGMNVRVINMPTIKPIDEEIILTAARECGRIITVEEHSIIGGLGEAVCSVVSEKLPVPVRRIGVMDQFGHSGPANEVLRDYGLTADNIVNVIRDIVRPDAKA